MSRKSRSRKRSGGGFWEGLLEVILWPIVIIGELFD